uniref:Sideroflexin-3 n=1 Tax=Oncorhynchus kisutch TaxID=8019 RepID=A0A8C7LK79_ONCKI
MTSHNGAENSTICFIKRVKTSFHNSSSLSLGWRDYYVGQMNVSFALTRFVPPVFNVSTQHPLHTITGLFLSPLCLLSHPSLGGCRQPWLAAAYVTASTGAVVTALGLESLAKRLPAVMSRFVPFFAVAALNYGIPVTNENWLGESVTAAKSGIIQAVESTIAFPVLNASVLVGLCLVFATPLCCALFPQMSSMAVSSLEPDLQERIRQSSPYTSTVFFNKGFRTTQ